MGIADEFTFADPVCHDVLFFPAGTILPPRRVSRSGKVLSKGGAIWMFVRADGVGVWSRHLCMVWKMRQGAVSSYVPPADDDDAEHDDAGTAPGTEHAIDGAQLDLFE